jgi:hypothetical protein
LCVGVVAHSGHARRQAIFVAVKTA